MKYKILTFAVVLFAFSSLAFAQSVVITPRKVTYKRPKPFSEYKKSFTITYPKIKGTSAALSKKIENSLSYKKSFDLDVKEEINEIQWLEEAGYTVDYNKNGILGITLSLSGSGAYPSVYNKSVVVNLKTGERIKPEDVFIKLDEIAAMCKKRQLAEIKNALVSIKKANPDVENPTKLFQNADFKVENLNEFSVSDKGVTFLYDYGFPHVVLALQPDGEYFFSWSQLKPFIKPAGLFAKFKR